MERNDEAESYRRAKARVEELQGYYAHLGVYLAVNLGLFLINWLTSDNWWFFWPLIGWGIGLAIHTFVVFGVGHFFGPEWEARKIREEMERQHHGGTV